MNEELREHIKQALDKGVRYDKRNEKEFRDIEVETGIISTAEGSARVKCGQTDVIAGVKMSLGTPFPDKPDDGVLMVNAELLPLSNPEFESGPPGIDAIEISRIIDRGLRECGVIDTKALCLEPGKKVWMINVDVVPINYDGNLLDVGGLAAILALKNAKFPEYSEDDGVNYEEMTDDDLPLTDDDPLPVTVVKIGDHLIVDPTENEENVLDARLTVTILKDGTICSLQKGGDHSLKFDELEEMIDIASDTVEDLRKNLK